MHALKTTVENQLLKRSAWLAPNTAAVHPDAPRQRADVLVRHGSPRCRRRQCFCRRVLRGANRTHLATPTVDAASLQPPAPRAAPCAGRAAAATQPHRRGAAQTSVPRGPPPPELAPTTLPPPPPWCRLPSPLLAWRPGLAAPASCCGLREAQKNAARGGMPGAPTE